MTITDGKGSRLEVRTTSEQKALFERAAAARGTNVSHFVLDALERAAQQVLADRKHFELSLEAMVAWEAINARPARELPGLRKLMERPSPFVDR